MIVIGIDPGTGARSPTGYCRFNADTKAIYEACRVDSAFSDPVNRIHDIAKKVHDLIACDGYPPPDLLCIESTVLPGRGNNSYQQLVGGFISATPRGIKISLVSNMTMKKLIGGTGKADKADVANGVLDFFTAKQLVADVESAHWDVTDALGVGLAGYQLAQKEQPNGRSPTKRKRSKKTLKSDVR